MRVCLKKIGIFVHPLFHALGICYSAFCDSTYLLFFSFTQFFSSKNISSPKTITTVTGCFSVLLIPFSRVFVANVMHVVFLFGVFVLFGHFFLIFFVFYFPLCFPFFNLHDFFWIRWTIFTNWRTFSKFVISLKKIDELFLNL